MLVKRTSFFKYGLGFKEVFIYFLNRSTGIFISTDCLTSPFMKINCEIFSFSTFLLKAKCRLLQFNKHDA